MVLSHFISFICSFGGFSMFIPLFYFIHIYYMNNNYVNIACGLSCFILTVWQGYAYACIRNNDSKIKVIESYLECKKE